MPNMESVFLTAQNDIEKLVASDIYPRFVRHQISLSATRALASNKNKYAGLGDCFVLTNPSKADNPIVYASDGFVKVTGYERNEIIPRNCRFLQTRQTDRESVGRLKKCLDNPAESVELLLNETKKGEPFWNLLYTGMSHPRSRTILTDTQQLLFTTQAASWLSSLEARSMSLPLSTAPPMSFEFSLQMPRKRKKRDPN